MKLAATTLEIGRVRLEPFEARHRPKLAALAEAEPLLFRHIPWPIARDGYGAWFDAMLAEQRSGRAIAHAVLADGEVVGQSCYLNIRASDAGVEIGSTWYVKAAQGGVVNPSAKLLLLGHAFASGAERVELKTDALNLHSRAAMAKLGAVFEGVHRRHMRRPDGSMRDTAWYSVIREDWPAVKAALQARLGQ